LSDSPPQLFEYNHTFLVFGYLGAETPSPYGMDCAISKSTPISFQIEENSRTGPHE